MGRRHLPRQEENGSLKDQVRTLRAQNVALADQAAHGRMLDKLFKLDDTIGVDGPTQVTARVNFQSPIVWYSTITINKGSNAGIREHQAVVNQDGLVGLVDEVYPNGAKVQLITDRDSHVPAKVAGTIGKDLISGMVSVGSPGDPNDLLLGFLQPIMEPKLAINQVVETSGISEKFSPISPSASRSGRSSASARASCRTPSRSTSSRSRACTNLDYVQVITKPQS